MSESNSEFLARMKQDGIWLENTAEPDDLDRLIELAEDRVMIGEHQMDLLSPYAGWSNWQVSALDNITVEDTDLSTAIRAVDAKIKEGK